MTFCSGDCLLCRVMCASSLWGENIEACWKEILLKSCGATKGEACSKPPDVIMGGKGARGGDKAPGATENWRVEASASKAGPGAGEAGLVCEKKNNNDVY